MRSAAATHTESAGKVQKASWAEEEEEVAKVTGRILMFGEAAGVRRGAALRDDEGSDLGRLQVTFYHVLMFQHGVGGSREQISRKRGRRAGAGSAGSGGPPGAPAEPDGPPRW